MKIKFSVVFPSRLTKDICTFFYNFSVHFNVSEYTNVIPKYLCKICWTNIFHCKVLFPEFVLLVTYTGKTNFDVYVWCLLLWCLSLWFMCVVFSEKSQKVSRIICMAPKYIITHSIWHSQFPIIIIIKNTKSVPSQGTCFPRFFGGFCSWEIPIRSTKSNLLGTS